jgi:hypothetical protein
VRVHLLNFCFTLCNIYLPPVVPVSPADLTNLISQLPPPFILLGDFNARNILWGAVRTDERGRSVHDVCAGFDLILLNTDAHTHLCLVSGTSSALDLAFCSPGLAVHVDWSVLPDLHGSDHYPVNLHIFTPSPAVSRHPNWINRRTDWDGFSQSLIFEDQEFPSVNSMVEYFTSTVSRAASQYVPSVVHHTSSHTCPVVDRRMSRRNSRSEASPKTFSSSPYIREFGVIQMLPCQGPTCHTRNQTHIMESLCL